MRDLIFYNWDTQQTQHYVFLLYLHSTIYLLINFSHYFLLFSSLRVFLYLSFSILVKILIILFKLYSFSCLGACSSKSLLIRFSFYLISFVTFSLYRLDVSRFFESRFILLSFFLSRKMLFSFSSNSSFIFIALWSPKFVSLVIILTDLMWLLFIVEQTWSIQKCSH